MIFLKTTIYKCIRLRVNTIQSITVTMHAPVQILLGRNGSGKSTLARLCSPMPAQSSMFYPGGYVENEIEHRGSHYVISSFKRAADKHSFVKDGVELNPGGTARCQTDCVKKYFRLDKTIMDILQWKKRFTSMSSLERKEIILRLSPNDYDFAQRAFAMYQKQHRDIVGTIAREKKRYVVEKEKLVSEDVQQNLRKEVQGIVRQLNELLPQRRPKEHDIESLKRSLESQIEDLRQRGRQALALQLHPRLYKVDSLQELEDLIDTEKNHVRSLEQRINERVNEHLAVSEELKILEQSTGAGRALLVKRKQDILTEVARIKDIVPETFWGGFSESQIRASYDQVHRDLYEALYDLPENPNLSIYNNATIDTQTLIAEKSKTELKSIRDRLAKAVAWRQHADEHINGDGVEKTCPKCQHRWIGNEVPKNYDRAVEIIKELEQQASVLEDTIQKSELQIRACNDYLRKYELITYLERGSQPLQYFWHKVHSQDLVLQYPRSAANLLSEIEVCLKHADGWDRLHEELRELESLLKQNEDRNDDAVDIYKQRLKRIEQVVEDATAELSKAQYELRTWIETVSSYKSFMSLKTSYEELFNECDTKTKTIVMAMERELISETISELQVELSRKESILSGIDYQSDTVKDLGYRIEQMEQEEYAARIVLKELSPTEGLIAESLMGFIKHMVGIFNSIIKNIWSHPMVMKTCGFEDDQSAVLNFKFPLVLNDNEDDAALDVSESSDGQKEIIDFAFIWTVMRMLDMEDYPLWFDEFGKSMDAGHATIANRTIKHLVDEGNVPQVIIASHAFNQHSIFSNREVIVLDPKNIIVPDVYNTHVVMEN